MLKEQSRQDWSTRERGVPTSEAPRFEREGLVLGAGTVLIGADGTRRLKSLKGHEAHMLALLSAAYGRAVAPSVLGGIERATKAWNAGDDCLAYMYLAHAAGLGCLPDLQAAANRLFIADCAMTNGDRPATCLTRCIATRVTSRRSRSSTTRNSRASLLAVDVQAGSGRGFYHGSPDWTPRRSPSLEPTPRVFSAQPVPPWRPSGCCSSRLRTTFMSKMT